MTLQGTRWGAALALLTVLLAAGPASGWHEDLPDPGPPGCTTAADAEVTAIAYQGESPSARLGVAGCSGDALRTVATWTAGDACLTRPGTIAVGASPVERCFGGYCGPIGLGGLPNTCTVEQGYPLGSDACLTSIARAYLVVGPVGVPEAQAWVQLDRDEATVCGPDA